MFSVPHLVIIFIVVLVVFGPHRLPELARGLGKMMAEFRKASTDFKMAFEEEMRTIERQARDAEFKKSQEVAAAAASSQQQPATLGTPAGAETPRILPEPVTPPEPVISPVTGAVSREAHSSGEPDSVAATAPTVTEQPVSDDAVTEGTSAESQTTDPSPRPANDQRQPA
jgi:sec-independent protein translocase protein TatB